MLAVLYVDVVQTVCAYVTNMCWCIMLVCGIWVCAMCVCMLRVVVIYYVEDAVLPCL